MALVVKETKKGLDETKMIKTIKTYDSYKVIEKFILDKLMVFGNGEYKFRSILNFYYNALDDVIEDRAIKHQTVAEVKFNLNLLRKKELTDAFEEISRTIYGGNDRDNSSGIYTDDIRIVANYINSKLKKKFTDAIKEYQTRVIKKELPYNDSFLIEDFPIDAIFKRYAFSYKLDNAPDYIKELIWDYIVNKKGPISHSESASNTYVINTYEFNRIYSSIVGCGVGDKETLINRYLEECGDNFYQNLVNIGLSKDIDMSFLDKHHKLNILKLIYNQNSPKDRIKGYPTFFNSIKPNDVCFVKHQQSYLFSDIFNWKNGMHDIMVYDVSNPTWDDVSIFFLDKHRNIEKTLDTIVYYNSQNKNRLKFSENLYNIIKSHSESFEQYMSLLGQKSIVDDILEVIGENVYRVSEGDIDIDTLKDK